MVIRLLAFVVVLIVLFGAIFYIYRFFSERGRSSTKILSINTEGKFENTEFKLTNDERFQIRNKDDVNQTVKIGDRTLAEIDARSTSSDIELQDDSKNEIYLASDESQKANVLVGDSSKNINVSTHSAPEAEEKDVQGAVNQNNEPLPNTGPGETMILLGLAFAGFAFFAVSKVFWKVLVR